jgi:hypothetical protein
MGSMDRLTPPLCERVARGTRTSQRVRPDRLVWALARGLIARLHLLDVPDKSHIPLLRG